MKRVVVRLFPGEAKHQISRHLYGHFAEHLGRGIYGGIFVGEHRDIPNTNGIRLDVLEALKRIKLPNLRWPGGCFADTYHWRDGIGPRGDRPSIVNTWWGGVTENNSFGTHDFLNLCELLGAEPFISANVGSGTVKDLMEWVQYVNFDGESPMSEVRERNGREKPWAVRYWGLGNEPWGCGGNMRAEYYADIFRQYATFMTDWSNSTGVFRVAAGAQSDDYHWTEIMMRNIPHRLMEGVGLHHYSVIDWNNKGPAVDFSDHQFYQTMMKTWMMEELLSKHGAIMDRYDPARRIALIVDEWGGWYDPEPGTNPGFLEQQSTMRDALIAAVTLNIFNAHADRVRLANLAQAVNVLQCLLMTDGERMALTPTFHVFELFTPHHDALLVPMVVDGPTIDTSAGTLPAVSVSASIQEDRICVTIANISLSDSYTVDVAFSGSVPIPESASILSSPSVRDVNSFDIPTRVSPKRFDQPLQTRDAVTFAVPPASVVALILKT